MSNQEILTKAIEKAIAGGWPALNLGGAKEWLALPESGRQRHINNMIDMGSAVASQSYPIIIFNHQFAKALWGLDRLVCDSCHVDVAESEDICWNCGNKTFVYEAYQNTKDNLPNWKYHLQQMVIAENPLDYLKENI